MAKAQGLSINTIIVLALALLVLLVLGFIVSGRFQIFGKGLSKCNGVCAMSESQCPSGTVGVPTTNCKAGDLPEIKGDGFCCVG